MQSERQLVLVGGGHAQLSVLKALAKSRPSGVAVKLVTPYVYQRYSGMLPGWMAGYYSKDDCSIDLRPLAEAAGVELILQSVVSLDVQNRHLSLSGGHELAYDWLSLDVGSEADLSWLDGSGDLVMSIRPLDDFFRRWPLILAQATAALAEKLEFKLIVVGGGAAGVELAFAANQALQHEHSRASISIVANSLLPGHAPSVKKRVRVELSRQGISVHVARAMGAAGGLTLSNGQFLGADCIVAATGTCAPKWLSSVRLALDGEGYVRVDAQHRSSSHQNVFAAGDVCSRDDLEMAKSGVHAVHAGPVLAHNLLACIAGTPLRSYSPRTHSLYLLACGNRQAVSSWGPWSAQGAWVWRIKDWIDRGFITRHRPERRPA